ncbi:MAG TPA: chromosomal replication initiator protein DnaA, partial [Chloroflexota bacterium]
MDEARTAVTGGRAAALDLWQAVSEELRSTLGDDNFETWFGKVDPVELREDNFLLAVPDEYTREWLQGRLHPVLLNALALAGSENITLTYTIEAFEADEDTEPVDGSSGSSAGDDETRAALSAFNPHYTFAEYIVGSGNRLAHASALACVDKPGRTYNPLVLYGGVGVGKTHLLQAIGQEAIAQGKGRVLFTTSEAFTNELVASIRDGSTGPFRDRYRSVDFLLLDDVQFIAGKEATQEEFFHTFNSLHQAGKQIVLTSDRPPSELRVLQDRLRSRFAWGLTVDLQPPDLETRIAIVRAKADTRHRRLHETVVNALATRASANVRELEGALNRVLALADLLGTEPGMEIARTVLGDVETGPGTCRPDDVLQAVSA